MKHTLNLIVAAFSILLPVTAAAYVPPDQYVYVDEYGLPPPTARHAQERVEAQNALYAERRQQESGTYTTTYGSVQYPSVVSGSGQPGYVVLDPPHDVIPDGTLGQSIDDLIMSVDELSATVADLQANRAPVRNRPSTWIEPPAHPWQPGLPSSGTGTWLLLGLAGVVGVWMVRQSALEA